MVQKEPIPMWMLWRNKIAPMDLMILKELARGTAESKIPSVIQRELKISMSRPKVRQKIKDLKGRGVILQRDTIVVDPAKLYGHIYLAFIKTFLTKPPPAPPPYAVEIKAWKEAFEAILEVDKKFGNPIRMLFNVGGTGDYDFIALIYTNNPEKYHAFKDALVKETGIIEKYDTKYVDVPELFYFDPISIPDHSEYIDCLKRYRSILEELSASQ